MKKTQPFLSLKETQQAIEQDPLGNFFAGIKSPETRDSYRKTLKEFLFVVQEFSGKFEDRAQQFYNYAKDNPASAKNLLKIYAKHLKTRSEKDITSPDYLKPTVVPNKFKGIRKFLQMNEIPMEWSGIKSMFPEITNVKHTRGYTTAELQKLLEYC